MLKKDKKFFDVLKSEITIVTHNSSGDILINGDQEILDKLLKWKEQK